MDNALDHLVAVHPFRLGVEDDQCEAWRILDRGAVRREENYRKGCAGFELTLDELAERRSRSTIPYTPPRSLF